MAWFYEIRSSNNAALKRDVGFPTQDAAKIAGREDAKKMKNLRQPDKPDVERILVGQNAEKATLIRELASTCDNPSWHPCAISNSR
jgi:hypothetical protein